MYRCRSAPLLPRSPAAGCMLVVMSGEFGGRDVPIIGVLRTVPWGQGYREIAPDVCPRGHELGPGRVTVGWHGGHALRQYTCATCWEQRIHPAAWCVARHAVPDAQEPNGG